MAALAQPGLSGTRAVHIRRYRSPLALRDLWPRPGDAVGLAGIAEREAHVATASASDALHLVLRRLAPSGTVVLPAYTCLRVVNAIRASGWTPAFVDLAAGTLDMDDAGVERALARSAAPRVVLATHLHGIPTDTQRLAEQARAAGATLVEDCAMAHGALRGGRAVGAVGDFALHSFGLAKVFSFGVGGLLSGDAARLAGVAQPAAAPVPYALRLAGRTGALGDVRMALQEIAKRALPGIAAATRQDDERFVAARLRPSAQRHLVAVLGSSRMHRAIAAQRERSLRWQRLLADALGPGVTLLAPKAGDAACYPGVPLVAGRRDALQAQLRAIGVEAPKFFEYCAAVRDDPAADFPHAMALAARILVLPLSERTDRIGAAVLRVLGAHSGG